MTSAYYRSDIDGLRTLAVVPVILYHAGASWMPGGFVGVDIFFVISGYLISTIIFREVSAGEFSFLRFYERRLRRIIPALLVVLVATIVLFQIIALPNQAQQTAESGVAALFSVSNFYFWRTTGYFSTSAEYMPLLHTWSLAVEEQFYLLFPVIVLVLVKLRLPMKWVFAFGTIAAFAVAYWLSLNKPSVAYYLLPARAWELSVGAVLAVGLIPTIKGKTLQQTVPVIGVGLIIFSLFYINSDMAFPGWVALMPCLGTAMVIHAGGGSWIARNLLSARPTVFIGLLSYSLYLWHWPVLTALRVNTSNLDLSLSLTIAGIAITFLLAWASWRFVETPFRDRSTMGGRRMLSILGGGGILISGIGALSIATEGFPSRLSERGNELMAAANDTEHYTLCPDNSFNQACSFGSASLPKRVVVIGDSHAPTMLPSMAALAAILDAQGVMWWHKSCPLLIGAWRENKAGNASCAMFQEQAIKNLAELPNLSTVVLVGDWVGQLELGRYPAVHPLVDAETIEATSSASEEAFVRSLKRSFDALELAGVEVLVISAPPAAPFDVPQTLALAELNGIAMPDVFDSAETRERESHVENLYRTAIGDRRNVHYVPIWDVFCPKQTCALTSGNTPLYSDIGHMSAKGATEFLGPVLIQRVKTITSSLGNAN